MPIVYPIGPITPIPSKTPSVTPSVSATPSVTPTISVSSSPGSPPSPPPSITPTVTPTISVTPSISISVTPSITPTPTINCSNLTIFDQMQAAALDYMKMAVGYYKINLSETKRNIYGESLEKWYYEPLLVRCLMERSPDTIDNEMFGSDVKKSLKLTIPKIALDNTVTNNVVGANILPEIGDIILDRGTERYYEVHNIVVNYIPVVTNYTPIQLQYCPAVNLVIYEMECYQTRASRLNLLPDKLL